MWIANSLQPTANRRYQRRFCFLLVFVLLVGFVSAEDGWGEFVDEGESASQDDRGQTMEDGEGVDVLEGDVDLEEMVEESSLNYWDSVRYTRDFYVALGVGVGALLLFLLLLFLLLRKPKNRWKKRKVVK